MAKPLKEAGLREVDALRRRVARQLSLKRITALDATILDRKINELEKFIKDMEEQGRGETR